MHRSKTTGIILAGGQSRRMGMEKGLVILGGRPLIQYALLVLESLCDEILISSNCAAYDHLGYKVVADVKEDSGPMGGIYSCLRESKTQNNLVLSCDMPFITNDIFHHLARHINNSWACVPWHEKEHFEPLCGIYTREILPVMEDFILKNNYKIPDLYKTIDFKALKISEINPTLPEHYFMNINSQEDLARAEALIST